MKAFNLKGYGKKEKLHLTEIAEPVIRENDVLVQIHAAGVNLLDSKIKGGELKLILPYKPPVTLGHDVAGVVTKIGSAVGKFKVGDAVYARPKDHRIGAFAQFIAISTMYLPPMKTMLLLNQKPHDGRIGFHTAGRADRLAGTD